ncbi:restriction endonuclease [Fructilactobacillus sp. Tb1]|uniref:restriction endonuclease n=1 Tax=Fructilactobacillus sp. Tb1 TaxID=3422304 RepID=UPI003D267E93
MTNKAIKYENLTMGEVLKSMHRLGGPVTRKEIRQDIRDNSDIINEETVDKIKTSKKSGNEYQPFLWTLNFAVKYLIHAGYIKTENNRELQLSEKGRTVNLDEFDAQRAVRDIVDEQKNTKTIDKLVEEESDSETELDDQEDSWKDQLLDALKKMNHKKFELFCRGLLKEMGIIIDDKLGIEYTGDGGIDGFGYVQANDYRTTRVALQAKRWEGKVSSSEIDKFRGAMDKHNAEFGVFITNSDFTRNAIEASRQGTRMITLINGDKICELVKKYEYYVEPVITYKLKSFYLEDE